jgi:hypothetical protein
VEILIVALQATRRLAVRAAAAVLVGWASGLVWRCPAAAQTNDMEYAVKAAYLYKFAPFVAWPPTAFRSLSSPFTLCVVGRDPFGDVLDQVTSGQSVYGRPIVVRRLATVSRDTDCRIMYVAGSDIQPAPAALAAVRGLPVLTVTSGAGNSDAKGIINFVIQNDRVRFAIDEAAAAANGLAISSKLLSLAAGVTPRPVSR